MSNATNVKFPSTVKLPIMQLTTTTVKNATKKSISNRISIFFLKGLKASQLVLLLEKAKLPNYSIIDCTLPTLPSVSRTLIPWG